MITEQTLEDRPQEISAQPTVQNGYKKRDLPPLESGDRLTRQEFERRYHAMPYVKRAELIEGIVYIASPVRFKSHSKPHAQGMTWLGVYWSATPNIQLGDNATVRLDPDNEVQPDALLRIEPEQGGSSQISDDDYIEGTPELIVEVAYSSASYDLHDKLEVYRRNGVKEYLVWKTYDNKLDWFWLHKGEYVLLKPDTSGVIRSKVFPGLYLAVKELLKGNLSEVLSVLQNGLQKDEHREFVEQLSKTSG